MPTNSGENDRAVESGGTRLRQIGFLPLLALFYGYTAGGPFGYEGIFHDSGPGMAILFLAVVPLFWQVNAWATRQLYIALGFFLSAAAMLGIDACPMEGFQPEQYDAILGLTQMGYGATVLATAGYRAADDPYIKLPKVRFKPEDVVVHLNG